MYATANKLAKKKQTKQKTWKSGMGFKEEVVTEKCETRYCRLCKKKETRKQCSYGPNMWDRYAVKDASDSERKEAAEESGITSEGGEGVSEGTKSGDSSLRDWFSKSKSSDGKPGWVQLGGKYAGKPCAKQPGQTTKPKCGSSKMKRNLNKDEEEAAFRRKQKEDPNPNRKGKAINVKTEATYPQDFKGGSGVAKKKKGRPNAQGDYGKKDLNERGDFWHPDPDKDRKLGGPGANQRAREDRAAASKPKSDPKKLRPGESYMEYAKRMKTRKEEVELTAEGKGEKDACYKKVKSRYSVWPSAYASGALVKCRKVGAANWGNKSESFSNWREELGEAKKCWPGYKKVGTQKLFGKTYNRCVKKEDIELTDAYGETFAVVSDVVKPEKLEATVCPRCGHNPCICDDTYDIDSMIESVRMPSQKGNLVESINNAQSSEQAKIVYETLKNTVGNATHKQPESLSEAVGKRSSTSLLLKAQKSDDKPKVNESNIFADRMQVLAGIKNLQEENNNV